MDQDQVLVMHEREIRIFEALKVTVDLMIGSTSQEVRETHSVLSFLLDEYEACRKAFYC